MAKLCSSRKISPEKQYLEGMLEVKAAFQNHKKFHRAMKSSLSSIRQEISLNIFCLKGVVSFNLLWLFSIFTQ